MCILLVEDEKPIRTLCTEVLREHGFEVRDAEDGDQASVLIAQDPTIFTLLVTDIHMPGSLDGTGVARVMRTHRPGLPIIYMSGRPDLLNSLQPFGPRETVLRKPFALSNLVATVQWLLGHGREDQAGRSSLPTPHSQPLAVAARNGVCPDAHQGRFAAYIDPGA